MKQLLKKLSAYLQTKGESFRKHNEQYQSPGKLETERAVIAEYYRKDAFNGPELKFGQLLSAHPTVRQLAVDIGSGTGWISAELAKRFARVVAIEPSAAAIAIAKQLYPPGEFSNIEWREGFAETVLEQLPFNSPTLFVTGVVFSHLRDREVVEICQYLNTRPAPGSLLVCNEAWGAQWHQLRWHVRTEDWWVSKLSNWQLDFHGPKAVNGNWHLGFHGVKKF